jgi:hypothetical protein
MSEPVDSPTPERSILPSIPCRKPLVYWFRRFLACNPFYLVSAALLLYGFYRVSIDPDFLHGEIPQLAFDMTSLQLYEMLLVITAIWLAKRCVWYDSTLLVWLENAFALVPFILISQAGLIDQKQVWILCFAASLVVLARFGSLKRFIAKLNFPNRFLGVGFATLAVNAVLPILYRVLHQSKVGTKPDWGAAYFANEYAWILLLPGVCALANLLPPARQQGELLMQRRWLPLGLFSLWFAATSVHLYCLGYVYDFDLRRELLAPALCIALWTLRHRLADFVPAIDPIGRRILLVSPFLATFLGFGQHSKEVFLLVTIWNASMYGISYWRHGEKLALHLLLLSLAAMIGGMPRDWASLLPMEFSRARCIGAAAAVYLLLLAPMSRDPRWGLVGALLTGTMVILLGHGDARTFHWASQAGCVFLLLHSLRWADADHSGARVFRLTTAAIWVAHSFAWMRFGGAAWMTCATGALVLATYVLGRILSGNWGSRVVVFAAILAMLSRPGAVSAGKVSDLPAGLIAVIGSFLLFACGTLAALTRSRWHKANS